MPVGIAPQSADPDMSQRRRFRGDTYSSIEDAASDFSVDGEGGGLIDFGSVALYVPGLQITLALCLCCASTVVVSTASTVVAVSGVRTATVSALVGMAVLWRPCYVSYARGVDIMFDALRPALVIYMMALIVEQLVHSCGTPHVTGTFSVRNGIFYVCAGAMTIAGFMQASNPKRQTDYPFLIVALSLVVAAIFTPPPRPGEGPLCEPPSLVGAVERIFRSLLFSFSYCSIAYASEPTKHSVRAILLCAMRATTGSVWVLCVHRYLMILAAVQGVVVTWARLQNPTLHDKGSYDSMALQRFPMPPTGIDYESGGLSDDNGYDGGIPEEVGYDKAPPPPSHNTSTAKLPSPGVLPTPRRDGVPETRVNGFNGLNGIQSNGSYHGQTPGQQEMAKVAMRLMADGGEAA